MKWEQYIPEMSDGWHLKYSAPWSLSMFKAKCTSAASALEESSNIIFPT
jgi:hypothetical protein